MNETNAERYDRSVVDLATLDNIDVNIKPEKFIYTALLKAQSALLNENITEGIIQYRLIIEHIETLCRSSRMLRKGYEEQIEEYKKTKEYKESKKTISKDAKLANKKMELLLSTIFSNSPVEEHLELE